jgi:hypothetical protein
MEFSKADIRKLRELAGDVYEAEAHQLLTKLDQQFDAWRNGALGSLDLLQTIHEFHQGESRPLWSMYHGITPGVAVERGLRLNLIAEDRIPVALRAKLRPEASGP